MVKIGYARVSTIDQDTSLQISALQQFGCEKIYQDKASGAKTDRPELLNAISYLREGDTLVVWKLDRLGRSINHLIQIINDLEERNVGFKSLTENIDTTTPGGKLVFHLFGALAQFERDLIKERTRAGLKAARDQGRIGGRPVVMTDEKLKKAKEYLQKGLNVQEAAARIKVSKTTLYKALNIKKSYE
ncbi:Site-specific DNA recombinase SpoIVCA/DNA invertase PinE (SpoIVCA) (PDB:1GDT) [Commensalibacter communis]|uniref:Site-specific DNA recombinase SpoIVCA/DNA invertase PinE (SpoIVCA) n=1 Tax=Commensalibacter communis TaxID=2972786 RepID=A0A9W4TQ84_9PROT|nr:recombinase family protein [Commensalibacter communis]CAI3948250.1 Site-specific DNA recombinase SpoIVCA/DNA invertase PinE (SpoIVCA) (PDB:1GDT) [Commensalibacter communis]CAI3948738.1 Site-specific DNA recombinase SpoIVCA/DNA invertase PinE (SpoIVCA) (PDB:1GDT) [Commensalibacter communis]CAI3949816.1 Site-specific DNA recombinase SpoIVCA/DNA invertase PinE (SpoIVCA) (PDB:1GDT) [Commensalibacter communis]CAI3950103.1 Site-specific DNA recombinase SpoIVCA/DNA invertase PinE (SpoIVCA) (PDB:1GD